jgi:uncharacterized protein YjbJ (UPF0337 family)
MSEERIEGAARKGLGHLQDAAGGLVGDSSLQAKGKLNEAAGSVQNAYGRVKDQAHAAFDQAKDRAQYVYGDLEGYAHEKPLAALAISVGLGLALGLILWGGRKIVYVRR